MGRGKLYERTNEELLTSPLGGTLAFITFGCPLVDSAYAKTKSCPI
jgi:hypothetical protein